MSINHPDIAKAETAQYLQEGELVGQSADKLSRSRRFRNGVYRHIHAARIERQLTAENSELKAANDRLRHEKSHDELTGALRQQAFWAEVDSRTKEGKAFALVILDCDKFGVINNTFGHRRGDEVLRFIGEKFRREGDVLGRIGGDELALILRVDGRGKDDGLVPQQRMGSELKYVGGVVKECVDQQQEDVRAIGFGISFGGALWDPGSSEKPTDVAELYDQADQAMYQAKAAKGGPAR